MRSMRPSIWLKVPLQRIKSSPPATRPDCRRLRPPWPGPRSMSPPPRVRPRATGRQQPNTKTGDHHMTVAGSQSGHPARHTPQHLTSRQPTQHQPSRAPAADLRVLGPAKVMHPTDSVPSDGNADGNRSAHQCPSRPIYPKIIETGKSGNIVREIDPNQR